MLHRSGENLFENSLLFIDKSESIFLFSAYIQLKQLKQLNRNGKIKQIIVRWEVEDLCKGVSDLKLYNYCVDNNISLYRNTRLHMKAIWNNQDSLVFGSANITGRGIGELGNYNYELNGIENKLSFKDRLYLNRIIDSSEYVTEKLYHELKTIVENTELPTIEFPELPTVKSKIDYFLISQLPMSASPDDFYEVSVNSEDYDALLQNCAAHDAAIYGIVDFQNYLSFKNQLKENFNNHPFIIALKEHILNQDTKSLRYGGVVEWIQNITTTVPTPRRWDIKKEQIVNILYTWVCEFDDDFTWDRPNHSQIIYFNENN